MFKRLVDDAIEAQLVVQSESELPSRRAACMRGWSSRMAGTSVGLRCEEGKC